MRRSSLVPFGALLCLTACAVQTRDGTKLKLTSPEFPAYVERVFREQNRVADGLAFAIDGRPSQVLMDAEQDLIDACALLNELATKRRDQIEMSVRRRAAAARSAPNCERATSAAADALLAEASRGAPAR